MSTLDVLERPRASSYERRIELGVLLGAITALHRDGMLTESEYETKRRRLLAQL
jgi:hypothetical protein